MMNDRTKLSSIIVKTGFIIVGLVFILIGNSAPEPGGWQWMKISVDELIANIGALLALIAVLQWIFDERARNVLILEIVQMIKGDNSLQVNGVVDCVAKSKEINDDVVWREAEILAIGAQYSSRFLQEHFGLLQERVRKGKKTYFCCNARNSPAAEYLNKVKIGTANMENSLLDLEMRVRSLNAEKLVQVIYVDSVFRYSFIFTEKAIWMRFFTNANVHCDKVPAIKIKAKTPIFSFFQSDLKAMGIPL